MTMLATAPPPPTAEAAPPRVRPQLLRTVRTDPPYEEEPARSPDAPTGTPLTLHVQRIRGGAVLDLPALAWSDEEAGAAETAGASRAVEADLRRLFGRRRTPRCELPEPGPRAAAAARMLLEVLVGDRTSRQVAGWVSPRVLAGLETRTPQQHRSMARRPVLRSLHLSEPADGVAEVCAVVQTGPRTRAVALRMEGLDGRWTITALHVG